MLDLIIAGNGDNHLVKTNRGKVKVEFEATEQEDDEEVSEIDLHWNL